MRQKMNKCMSMLLVAVLCIMTGTALAFAGIDLETFNPRTGKYVYLLSSNIGTFQSQGGDIVESVNSSSDGALIPGVAEYKYMIRNVYENDYEKAKAYTEKLDGIEADDSYIDEMSSYSVAGYSDAKSADGTYKNEVNRSHFWWFKMSTETGKELSGFKSPEVKWTGLCIYNPEKKGYQDIDLYMKVEGHSMAGSFANRVPALFSVSKGVNGLPSIRMYHIRAVKLRFTAKIAGTEEVYPIKTSITFGDIDGRQSVSVSASSAAGFAAKESSNILFGPYGNSPDQYWTATGNTDSNIGGDSIEADNYKIAYYLDAGQNENGVIDLAFTSSQQDNNKPTGNFARFSASTYQNPDNAPEIPVIRRPVKYVSDDDYENDEDRGSVVINGKESPARTHNTLTDRDEITTYTVIQKIPPLMYSELEETDLSVLKFSDKLDDRFSYVDGSLRVYSIADSAAVYDDLASDPVSLDLYDSGDVTDKFDISFQNDSNKVTAVWKNGNTPEDRDRILYGDSDGAVLKFVFDVMIRDGLEEEEKIPNQAEITYKLKSQEEETVLRSVNSRFSESQTENEKEQNSFVYTTVKSEDKTVDVSFDKVAFDNKEKKVKGAALSIYKGEYPDDTELPEKPVCTWVTGEETYVCSKQLIEGETYTLVEEKAPVGYERADRIVFIAEKGQTVRMVDERKKQNIVISKNVTGSLGDLTKQFEFTFRLTGGEADSIYTAYGELDEYELGTDENGNGEFTFTLNDGEQIIIENVPEYSDSGEPVTYTVTEMPSDHRASYLTDTQKKKENESDWSELTTAALMVKDDHEVEFTNEREVAIVTGVSERYGLMAALFISALLMGSIIIIKRR